VYRIATGIEDDSSIQKGLDDDGRHKIIRRERGRKTV
jgi:hypothetical protein